MAKNKASTKRPSQLRTRLVLAASVIVPAVLGNLAHAVVLGPVHVRSNLGQPLVAEVELLDVDPGSLKADLASAAVHQQHNFQAPHLLGSVNVKLVNKRDGRRVLRVTSERAVNEPTLEVLLQAEDRAGSIVRYVPLLIDPAPTEAMAARQTTRDERETSGDANPMGPATAAPASQTAHAKAQSKIATTRTDRLAKADRAPTPRPKSKRPAAADAPSAPAPDRSARNTQRTTGHAAEAPNSAAAEVPMAAAIKPALPSLQKPGAAPQASLPQGSLPAPDEAPKPPALSANTSSSGLAPKDQASATDAAMLATAAATTQEGALADATARPDATAANTAPSSTANADETAAARNASKTTTEPQTPSVTDDGLLGTPLWAGAGVVLAGGLLALGIRRRRQTRQQPVDVPEPHVKRTDPHLVAPEHTPVAPMLSDKAEHLPGKRLVTRGPSVFNTSAFEMMDDADPLAEADVYIAYGRADHAQAILEDAIHADPGRTALYLKLLAIHFERRDPLAFAEQARVLDELTNGEGPEWQQAVTMGQRLDPANPLYATPDQSGQRAPSVDFDLSSPFPEQDANHSSIGVRPSQRNAGRAQLNDPPSTIPLADWDPAHLQRRQPISTKGPIDFSVSASPPEVDPGYDHSTTGMGLPLRFPQPEASASGTAADRHVIDFDLSDIGDRPQPGQAVQPSIGSIASSASAGIGAIANALPEAANASRFDELSTKLALVKELTRAGDRQHAARMAQEVAHLIAELRNEASHIMLLAQRCA